MQSKSVSPVETLPIQNATILSLQCGDASVRRTAYDKHHLCPQRIHEFHEIGQKGHSVVSGVWSGFVVEQRDVHKK